MLFFRYAIFPEAQEKRCTPLSHRTTISYQNRPKKPPGAASWVVEFLQSNARICLKHALFIHCRAKCLPESPRKSTLRYVGMMTFLCQFMMKETFFSEQTWNVPLFMKMKIRRSLRAKEKTQNVPLSSCATPPIFVKGAYLRTWKVFFSTGRFVLAVIVLFAPKCALVVHKLMFHF
jgi:hypothetical protein